MQERGHDQCLLNKSSIEAGMLKKCSYVLTQLGGGGLQSNPLLPYLHLYPIGDNMAQDDLSLSHEMALLRIKSQMISQHLLKTFPKLVKQSLKESLYTEKPSMKIARHFSSKLKNMETIHC